MVGVRPFFFLLAALLSLTGCTNHLMGVDRSALPPSLALQYDRAQTGDKQALYALGIAYGAGIGIPQDCKKAKQLLRMAAASSGGRTWVYSPPVGNGTSGRVIPVDSGPPMPGLGKAQMLLDDPGFCSASSG